MVSVDALCPAGMSATTICHARTALGAISGLGKVTQEYMYNGDPARCPEGDVKILGYTTSFRVAGKGEIHFVVADAPTCLTSFGAGLTPPTFSGATSKTVRAPKSAKRVRVSYDVDGERRCGRPGSSHLYAGLGQSIPDRPHGGQLLGDRYKRKHGHLEASDHSQEKALRKAPERRTRCQALASSGARF